MPTDSGKDDSPSGDAPRFDAGMLHRIAGETTFVRGATYHAEGRVAITAVDAGLVVANVQGSELYCAELTIRAGQIVGDCTCPAFADMGFCKHLVATALAANALTAEHRQQIANRYAPIRDHLLAQSVVTLSEIIMGQAARDPALMRRLELAVATGDADDERAYARFTAAIAEATSTDEYISYGEVRAWAGEIAEVLDQVERLIDSGRADIALRIMEDFFVRMDEALLSLDDSSGHAGAVFCRARDIHLRACEAVRPNPVLLARELFEREMECQWDFFYGASDIYDSVLGEAGLAEYRRLAEDAWGKMEPRRAGRRAYDEQFTDRFQLQSILERFAERDGDLDARIALRAKDLSSPYSYLGIAELCLSHSRDAEALKWAEEGLWQFEDDPDERLVVFAADLYRLSGRPEEASGVLWRYFERLPSLSVYKQLQLAAGDDAGARAAVADRALEVLEMQIASGRQAQSSPWRSDFDLLIEILLLEEQLTRAWQIVQVHGCSDHMLRALATASEQTHPAETLTAYAGMVERHVQRTGQAAYEEACRMIERMGIIRERRGEGGTHAGYLDDLLVRHKAKRNFVKLVRGLGVGGTPR